MGMADNHPYARLAGEFRQFVAIGGACLAVFGTENHAGWKCMLARVESEARDGSVIHVDLVAGLPLRADRVEYWRDLLVSRRAAERLIRLNRWRKKEEADQHFRRQRL